jgi:hypothetical protein
MHILKFFTAVKAWTSSRKVRFEYILVSSPMD